MTGGGEAYGACVCNVATPRDAERVPGALEAIAVEPGDGIGAAGRHIEDLAERGSGLDRVCAVHAGDAGLEALGAFVHGIDKGVDVDVPCGLARVEGDRSCERLKVAPAGGRAAGGGEANRAGGCDIARPGDPECMAGALAAVTVETINRVGGSGRGADHQLIVVEGIGKGHYARAKLACHTIAFTASISTAPCDD